MLLNYFLKLSIGVQFRTFICHRRCDQMHVKLTFVFDAKSRINYVSNFLPFIKTTFSLKAFSFTKVQIFTTQPSKHFKEFYPEQKECKNVLRLAAEIKERASGVPVFRDHHCFRQPFSVSGFICSTIRKALMHKNASVEILNICCGQCYF